MKQIIIAISLLMTIGCFQVQAQQEQSLFFMRNSFYSHYTNPAMLPEYRAIINFLPGAYVNISNTGFGFNDVFIERNDSTLFSPEKLLEKLHDNNFLQLNMDVDPISVAFRIKKFHFSIAYRARFSAYMNYRKPLFELAWYGNGPFIDQTVDIAPDLQMMAYNEFAIGGGYTFLDDKLTIGVRLKVLVGMFDVSTDRTSATLYTNPEIYQLELATDYRINSSSFLAFNLTDTSQAAVTQYGFDALPPNLGGAVDIGATYKLNDKWDFALSFTDIGAIRWTANVENLHSNGNFEYDGVDIMALLSDDTSTIKFDAITDTLAERFDFKESHNSYTTWLPAKMYIGAVFRPIKSVRVGAMFYGEIYRGQFFPAISLSAQYVLPGNWITAGLVYSYRNRRFDNLGLNLLFDLKGFQVFVVSDNIIPIFRPFSARNTNIRFGINLGIKRIKEDKPK